MSQLTCPYCGPRELQEFEFLKTLPNAGSSPFAQAYERIDSLATSREYWQHVGGCRAWLELQRNPATGAVTELRMLGADA